MSRNYIDNIGVRNDFLDSKHLAARFPTYFEEPTNWFAQTEAVFRIPSITRNSTKFIHLLSNLPASVLMDLQDVVTSTSKSAYEDLKNAIIKSNLKSNLIIMSTSYLTIKKLTQHQLLWQNFAVTQRQSIPTLVQKQIRFFALPSCIPSQSKHVAI